MIYLIRHGATEHNRQHIIQGINDVPLCEEGRTEILKKAELFKDRTFSEVLVSPLQRAQETAEILFENADVGEFITDNRLIEYDFGSNTGRPVTDLIEAEDQEDEESFYRRLADLLIDVARIEGNVALVTHGRVIASVIRMLRPDLQDVFFPIPNLAINLIENQMEEDTIKLSLKLLNATDEEVSRNLG